jgi:predicted metal-dependent phosphoesterase TrpH
MATESAQTSATIDLHTHTNASDGLDTPAELVANASQQGISVLGVTDHDTMDGLEAASEAATRAGITLVPGVELSTTVDPAEVHILGYFVDSTDSRLRARLSDLAAARVRRVERMIARLHELGYRVDGDAILAQAEEGSIGRPHVARALMVIGAVDSVNDAFDRFLKAGRPAYIPRDPFLPEDAVGLLVEYNAIPVLAHPFSTKDIEGTLARLVPAGLKGLETYYAEYSPEQHAHLRAVADGWGLVPTGGSDYHGTGFREGRELGAAPVPQDAWERLSMLHADLADGA